MVNNSLSGGMIARGFNSKKDQLYPLIQSKNIFLLLYGKALPESSRKSGKIPVFGTNGQCGWHNVSFFNGPGIILGRKGQGPLGVEWSNDDYWVIDTAYSLKLLTNLTDLRFTYYLIKYVGLNHLKDGTSNPSLNRDTFGSQYFPIPSLPIQKAIAHILGTLDDKIELNRRMNETLESIARAIFKSWFIDFDPVRAKAEGREPEGMDAETAALFPSEFEVVEGQEIPKGWKKQTIGDFSSLDKGLSYKGAFLSHEGVPMINLGCFQGNGKFSYDYLKFYTGEHKERHFVDHGSIVIANTDITQKREVLGSPYIIEEKGNHSKYLFTHHVFALRLEQGAKHLVRYIFYSLLQDEFRERAIGFATGTTVLALPRDSILNHSIVVPDSSVIHSFNKIVNPFFSKIQMNNEESNCLSTLRDTLLPKLLSGELSIPNPEQFTGIS